MASVSGECSTPLRDGYHACQTVQDGDPVELRRWSLKPVQPAVVAIPGVDPFYLTLNDYLHGVQKGTMFNIGEDNLLIFKLRLPKHSSVDHASRKEVVIEMNRLYASQRVCTGRKPFRRGVTVLANEKGWEVEQKMSQSYLVLDVLMTNPRYQFEGWEKREYFCYSCYCCYCYCRCCCC